MIRPDGRISDSLINMLIFSHISTGLATIIMLITTIKIIVYPIQQNFFTYVSFSTKIIAVPFRKDGCHLSLLQKCSGKDIQWHRRIP